MLIYTGLKIKWISINDKQLKLISINKCLPRVKTNSHQSTSPWIAMSLPIVCTNRLVLRIPKRIVQTASYQKCITITMCLHEYPFYLKLTWYQHVQHISSCAYNIWSHHRHKSILQPSQLHGWSTSTPNCIHCFFLLYSQ